jgi:hypothetical protein
VAKLHQRNTEFREAVDIERGRMRLRHTGWRPARSQLDRVLATDEHHTFITIASLVGVGAWIGGSLSNLLPALGP